MVRVSAALQAQVDIIVSVIREGACSLDQIEEVLMTAQVVRPFPITVGDSQESIRRRITDLVDIAVQQGAVTWPRSENGARIDGGMRVT